MTTPIKKTTDPLYEVVWRPKLDPSTIRSRTFGNLTMAKKYRVYLRTGCIIKKKKGEPDKVLPCMFNCYDRYARRTRTWWGWR